jgi:hypothetical protein
MRIRSVDRRVFRYGVAREIRRWTAILSYLVMLPVVFFMMLGFRTLFKAPGVMLSLVAILASVVILNGSLWMRPTRFLVLRPFYVERLGKSLVNVLRINLRHLGHVYTLPDNTIRQGGLKESIWFGSAVAKFLFYNPFIRTEKDLSRLQRQAANRFLMNVRWLVSVDKIFKVETESKSWKETVQALLVLAQVIVIDVSMISTKRGVLWELQAARDGGVLGRAILIADQESAVDALAVLRETLPEVDHHRLLLYDGRGQITHGRFIKVVTEVLASGS